MSVKTGCAIPKNSFSATQEKGEKFKRREQAIEISKTMIIEYRSNLIIAKYHLVGKNSEKNREPSNGGRGIILNAIRIKFIIPPK